jgi:hypothetical protein
MILQQFIDAGWYTVPLEGKITRTDSGKKTLPVFQSNWRKKNKETFNTTATPLGGAITGLISGIVAIDCDNQGTFDLFTSLDPDYKVHFVSLGKPEGGGTIIYKYSSELSSFKLADGTLALDFYADDGFIYLPTEDNHSKEAWTYDAVPELNEVPQTLKHLLHTLAKKQATKPKGTAHNSPAISNRLAPMIKEFTKTGKYSPVLFRIITPKSFRSLPTYVRQGHLHPEDIPEGRGSEYLSKISAILGADISISRELYMNAMEAINNLWLKPMETNRLMTTVINPMVEEKVMIGGNVIWQYDKHWKKLGFIATAMNGEYVESFFDDIKGIYYLINYTAPYIKTFSDKGACITTLKAMLGKPISESQFDVTKRLIRTSLDPSKEFGHISETEDKFNLFRQTPALDVLNCPEVYALQYNRPNVTIKYLETFMPDKYMRDYTLSFLRTKLTTFKYSPIVLYFIGVQGSGKDTFVSILSKILGSDYIAKPDARVFLEQYNGWILDKYFIQLDEYGNKLSRGADKQEALGKIKSYSGSPDIQIRAMRQDGFNYKHGITIILTANSSPLPIETQDRRIAFIDTPNRLDKQEWVLDMGGITEVITKINDEIMDFCYYLATEVKNLNNNDYVIAPETDDKEQLIIDSLPIYEQIAHYIIHEQFRKLEDLGIDNGISGFTDGWGSGKISHDKLMELYDAMTEGKGLSKVLTKRLKDAGIGRKHTTRNGVNFYFYIVNSLVHYAKHESSGGFENIGSGGFKAVEIRGI